MIYPLTPVISDRASIIPHTPHFTYHPSRWLVRVSHAAVAMLPRPGYVHHSGLHPNEDKLYFHYFSQL